MTTTSVSDVTYLVESPVNVAMRLAERFLSLPKKHAGLIFIVAALSSFGVPAWSECVDLPTSRYELRGGEAYDKVTHLTWARCSVGQKWDGEGCVGKLLPMTYDEAVQTAAPPWRLPTGKELLTIMAFCHRPAVNEEVFPGMPKVEVTNDHAFLYPNYWSFSGKSDRRPFVANFFNGGGTIFNSGSRAVVRLVRFDK